ncbi:hypothetical protein [Effusibacillus lacus]|uniref:Uncharacterized protein n=1 Tax=Effusibacillus lacus TaxID=1348429 RepID=A0A292YE03_9BACL|nr:hypothetical protein [Effusibacillus lacus]TCS74159.1 hypothetical protein EDD64_11513 [Effusibacillus lacus]GAX90842.1 hypothetical protein EFBL_2484 [Effusibacillus lacus]
MINKKILSGFLAFIFSAVIGAVTVFATQYTVTPWLNTDTNIYVYDYAARGNVYSTINVDKFGDSQNKIWAQYWVGHPYTKDQSMGVINSYDSSRMSLVGFREPDPNSQYNSVLNYKIESDPYHTNIRDVIANGTVKANTTGYIGLQYQIKVPSLTFDFAYYGSNKPHHSLAGYMVDYVMSWTSDVTVVNGNSMYIYQ